MLTMLQYTFRGGDAGRSAYERFSHWSPSDGFEIKGAGFRRTMREDSCSSKHETSLDYWNSRQSSKNSMKLFTSHPWWNSPRVLPLRNTHTGGSTPYAECVRGFAEAFR